MIWDEMDNSNAILRTATVAKVAPIWACNTGLTNYCCHVSQSPLPDPQSCCKDSGALFQLQQAVVIPWDSAVSVAAASSASAQLSSNAAMSANAVTTSTNTASSASRATTTLPPLSAFTSGITLTTDPAVIASHDASAAAAASVAAAYANGMSHATQVAVGVGVGVSPLQYHPIHSLTFSSQVGIAFLSILATLFWRVRSLQSLLRKDTEGHGEVRTRGVYEPAPTHDEATLCARAEKTAAATTAVAAVPAVPAEVETTGQIHEMPSRFRSELP
jgi:hypothetical protein